jgi:hypothetical protein
MKSTRRRALLLFASLCLVAALPARAPAAVGDKLEGMKQTDFFKFFNLTEAEPRSSEGGLTVVTFRPGGGNFRRLVKVAVTVGGDGVVRAMELTAARSFVDDPANGIFARDVAKSFLRAAVPVADAARINDLANEIEFPKELEGYEIARTRPDPKLPAQPTKGYLVYLGRQELFEESYAHSTLRLENVRAGGGVLHITVRAKGK